MKTGKSLSELAAEIDRRASNIKDYVAPSTKLRFHAQDMQLRVETPGVGDFGVNGYAHGQVAVNAGIPKPYYDRMLSSHPGLLAAQINHWFATEPKKHLVRTLDGTTRALLSDRYRPLDNMDLMQSVLPMIIDSRGEMQVVSSEVTDTRLYVKLAVPSLRGEVKVGDEMMAGVVIQNSEVGAGSLEVAAFVTRLVCTNGMKVDTFGKRRNHVGKALSNGDDASEFYQDDTRAAADRAFFLQVRDTVKGVLEPAGFERILSTLRQSTENKIEAKPEDAVEVLANKYTLNESQKTGIFRQLVDGGLGFTQYGLVQAITRVAEDQESYDEASRLEAAGGQILTLAPSEWKVISHATEAVPPTRRPCAGCCSTNTRFRHGCSTSWNRWKSNSGFSIPLIAPRSRSGTRTVLLRAAENSEHFLHRRKAMTKQTIRKDVWNTYATYCYTYDVANDQRSAGGVHLHQVRQTKSGWQKRIKQSNGRFASFGPVEPLSDAEGEAAFATAQQEAADVIRVQ